MPAHKLPREPRKCKCGCGETFTVLPSSSRRYAPTCKTLRNPSVVLRLDVIEKIRQSKIGEKNPRWKPKDIRLCACGCGETFACEPGRKRRFISVSHSKRGENNPMKNKAIAIQANSKPRRPKSPEGISNIANAARKRMKDILRNPIYVEENATKLLKARWPNMTDTESEFFDSFKDKFPLLFTGNGDLWIGGKCPDFIIQGTTIVIEVTRRSNRNEKNYTLPRQDHFSRYGYSCIVIWAKEKPPFFTKTVRQHFEQELHRIQSTRPPEPNPAGS